MLSWSLCTFFGLIGLFYLAQLLQDFVMDLSHKKQILILKKISQLLFDVQETLEAGLLPDQSQWKKIKDLPHPWGTLIHQSLEELRQNGGTLLPTLKRLRLLASEQLEFILEAQSKSAQAMMQAFVCGVLVPGLGIILYQLLPEIQNQFWFWILCCGTAMGITGIGSLWMIQLADQARWGGLAKNQRHWVLATFLTGERLLAQIRTGTPADLAWSQAVLLLQDQSPTLAEHWGASVWISNPNLIKAHDTQSLLRSTGEVIKKSIQSSLMEGKPSTERIETTLSALKRDLKSKTDHELALLATQVLKPLFIFIAPSVLGLLGVSVYLVSQAALS